MIGSIFMQRSAAANRVSRLINTNTHHANKFHGHLFSTPLRNRYSLKASIGRLMDGQISNLASASSHISSHKGRGSSLFFATSKNANKIGFNAINHTVFNDKQPPLGIPSPGDTFRTQGLGVLDTRHIPQLRGAELSYSYNIAGTITGSNLSENQLFFNHGLKEPNTSNTLTLYLDPTADANENDANSYTNGTKQATFDVVPSQPEDVGIFSPKGGKDQVTFKLSDADKQKLGLQDDIFLKINSTIIPGQIDPKTGQTSPFKFGAFGENCGSSPFSSCSKELGTSTLVDKNNQPVDFSSTLQKLIKGSTHHLANKILNQFRKAFGSDNSIFDFDKNGRVSFADLEILRELIKDTDGANPVKLLDQFKQAFGTTNKTFDFDNSGFVSFRDLEILKSLLS